MDNSEPARDFRYAAFISYSHSDEEPVAWFHPAIENYRIPAALVPRERRRSLFGTRIGKIFRDRDELSTQADLASAIEKALADSAALIVVCSPKAARSKYVNEEVRFFKSLGRSDRIFALIVDGEPHAAGKQVGGRLLTDEDECFPPALIRKLGADGTVLDEREDYEHIAADIRPGKDSRESAKLKLVAGLLGVGLDDLVRRDRLAARRRMRVAMAASGVFASVAAMAAYFGWDASQKGDALAVALDNVSEQRDEAERQRRVAVDQRELAERQRAIADEARRIADERRQEALRERDRATRAQRLERLAREQEARARQLEAQARRQEALARVEAVRQRDLALTREAQAVAALALGRARQGEGSEALALARQAIETVPAGRNVPEAEAALVAALTAPVDSYVYAHEQAPTQGRQISHDGHWLVTSASDGDIRLTELHDDPEAPIRPRPIAIEAPWITGALFSEEEGALSVKLLRPESLEYGSDTVDARFTAAPGPGEAVRRPESPLNRARLLAEGRRRALLQLENGTLADYDKADGTLTPLPDLLRNGSLAAAAPDQSMLLRSETGGRTVLLSYGSGGEREIAPRSPDAAAFSADGERLVLLHPAPSEIAEDGSPPVPDAVGAIYSPSGERLVQLDTSDGGLRDIGAFKDVAFGKDGETVVGLSEAGTVVVWRASDGVLLDHFAQPEDIRDDALRLSPDGRWAMTNTTLWRTERRLPLSQARAGAVDLGIPPEDCRRDEQPCPAGSQSPPLPDGHEWFNPSGNQAASADGRYRLAARPAEEGKVRVSMVGPGGALGGCGFEAEDDVNGAFVRSDGTLVVLVRGAKARIVDCTRPSADVIVEHGASRITGIVDVIAAVAFLDGNRIATAGSDRRYRIWDATTGGELLDVETGEWLDGFTIDPAGNLAGRESLIEQLRRFQRLPVLPPVPELLRRAAEPLPVQAPRRLQPATPAARAQSGPISSLPHPDQIDAVYAEIGIADLVAQQGLDLTDKDILYARAREMTPERLVERYPWLPIDAARQLIERARH